MKYIHQKPLEIINGLTFLLVCRPTGELSYPDEYHGLFTDDLTMVAEGSTLFNVYALDAPEALGGQEEWIGKHYFQSSYVFIIKLYISCKQIVSLFH